MFPYLCLLFACYRYSSMLVSAQNWSSCCVVVVFMQPKNMIANKKPLCNNPSWSDQTWLSFNRSCPTTIYFSPAISQYFRLPSQSQYSHLILVLFLWVRILFISSSFRVYMYSEFLSYESTYTYSKTKGKIIITRVKKDTVILRDRSKTITTTTARNLLWYSFFCRLLHRTGSASLWIVFDTILLPVSLWLLNIT